MFFHLIEKIFINDFSLYYLMGEYNLSSQNPWWLNPDAIELDEHILRFEECSVKWVPRIKHFFDLTRDAIYTVRGPRQVGKTTLVKLMIRELLHKDVKPSRRIFYWTCDLVEGPKELVRILEEYISTTRSLTKDRLYIFLDEISAVRDWQRGIKYLHDIGRLRNTTVIMTGSHSLDIRRAAERLPGRRGEVKEVMDKVFLPMKFSEYAETRSSELRGLLIELDLLKHQSRIDLISQIGEGKLPERIRLLNQHSDLLYSLFRDYLLTGGMIRALDEYLKEGNISQDTYSTYVDITIGDILRWDKREHYLVQLLRRIFETLCSRVSWNSLRKGTDIGHSNTVVEYVDILHSSFILNPIYLLDRSIGGPRYAKEKKLYIADPFIFHALRAWVYQLNPFEAANQFINTPEVSKLVECIICDHITRLAFLMNPTALFDATRNVFYWKGKKHEVDFILKMDGEYLPIEVKYKTSIDRSDFQGLFSFADIKSRYHGIVITRNTLEIKNDITLIPAHLFLFLI